MREGWIAKRLGDISVINYGYTAKASFDGEGPKFLRITDIQDDSVDWTTVPTCPISEKDFDRHQLFDNDIVFARTGATTGKSYLLTSPPESVAASYLIRLRLNDSEVLASYVSLFFQTRAYWAAISRGLSGSAQGGFNASKLAALAIPLPPPPEQKRIVAILDEAFAGIATAVANTEKNLANARELFEGYLNNVFTQKGEGWVENRLEEIGGQVSTGPFGSLLHKSDYVPNGTPLVNPANIVGASIVPNLEKTVNQDALSRLSAYVLHANDIVIGRRGEIGRCTVVAEEQDGWLCGTGSFFIRLS